MFHKPYKAMNPVCQYEYEKRFSQMNWDPRVKWNQLFAINHCVHLLMTIFEFTLPNETSMSQYENATCHWAHIVRGQFGEHSELFQ